tara:strand:- start:38 stop:439 length:402 start_codon:yes stop_codon:yes gene_type:complete
MTVKEHLPLYVSILVTMYFVSGVDKLFHFEKVVNGLQNRTPFLPHMICIIMIAIAVVIELIAPILCVYGSLKTNDARAVQIGMWGTDALILFTVVATLLYHFPPTTSSKYYPFMSNLATTGGLLVLRHVFRTQ